jgi:hypothetical protein
MELKENHLKLGQNPAKIGIEPMIVLRIRHARPNRIIHEAN